MSTASPALAGPDWLPWSRRLYQDRAPPTSRNASELLAQARSWLGTRYVFGGCSASGIDCSCFVQTIFRSVGIGLPRTSQQQYNSTIGRGLGTSSPEPG